MSSRVEGVETQHKGPVTLLQHRHNQASQRVAFTCNNTRISDNSLYNVGVSGHSVDVNSIAYSKAETVRNREVGTLPLFLCLERRCGW